MRLPFLRPGPPNDPVALGDLSGVSDRLDRLITIGERTNQLLEQLHLSSARPEPKAGNVSPKVSERAIKARLTQGGGRPPKARETQPAQGAAPLTLHKAIIQVLLDAGEPLTANDIAARVGDRKLYEPPRSGHELRGGQVSARVGNATYRRRFVRRDRKIWLADPDGERWEGTVL